MTDKRNTSDAPGWRVASDVYRGDADFVLVDEHGVMVASFHGDKSDEHARMVRDLVNGRSTDYDQIAVLRAEVARLREALDQANEVYDDPQSVAFITSRALFTEEQRAACDVAIRGETLPKRSNG